MITQKLCKSSLAMDKPTLYKKDSHELTMQSYKSLQNKQCETIDEE